MPLIRATGLHLAFGSTPLLRDASLTVPDSGRIALVGRNGEGKSTLLKLLAGQIDADSGELSRQANMRSAYLPQAIPEDLEGTVYEVVARGLDSSGAALADLQALTTRLEHGETGLEQSLAAVQARIDALDAWAKVAVIQSTLSVMDLDPEARFETLSGGMKRRVLLARAVVAEPDLLMLDEPTNHLDIQAIDWLEKTVRQLRCTVLLITHDRAFLDATVDTIWELDRGTIREYPGNYAAYRARKQQELAVEEEHNQQFDKKLAQEEAWIRQGIKARRTRNEGRVRALQKMRQQYRERVSRQGTATLSANTDERSAKKVIEAKGIGVRFGDTAVIRDLDLLLQRGDRLAIIGPNGCGKTTLVRALLGLQTLDSGTLTLGERVTPAYFDQLRNTLDAAKSAQDNVSGGRDTVTVNGASRHIISYMQDFLFTPARARAPITALSGGETARLMLARLFLQPANLLVLDEPSNDLDIETLELLEALLADYDGTVILISHDRALIDNVATRSLVFQGDGHFVDVVGGYADYERELSRSSTLRPLFDEQIAAPSVKTGSANASNGSQAVAARKKTKLSYKDQRELDQLPDRIAELEAALESLHTELASPEVYKDHERAKMLTDKASTTQAELDAAYQRWETLEDSG